ncbi:MAG: beta-N-acetylhexosaminidase, partial [Prevotella sp.]|nr:beta-N-acetylhexosaminidase [Prevotella sp.]
MIFSAVLALMSTAAVAAGKVTGSWNVIPMPQQVTLMKEADFVIDAKVGIKYDENNEKMVRNAQFLVDNIREIAGIRVGSLKKSAKNIVLSLDPSIVNPEGYRIRATKRELCITGATEAAVFYGIQTVTKALPVIDKQTQLRPNEATQIALPAANISDAPRYAYRGFLVDVGRHFFSVEYLKEMIDMFALHNINYFHWH